MLFHVPAENKHVLAGPSARRPKDLSYIERVRKFKMNVLVIYRYITNYLKLSSLEQCILFHSCCGSKIGHDLAGSSALQSLMRLQSQCLAMSGVLPEGLTGEESTAKFTHKAVGRIQFLRAFVSCWLLARCYLHFLCQMTNMAACFIQARRGSVYRKTEVTIFYNLITKVPSHYLCHTLWLETN